MLLEPAYTAFNCCRVETVSNITFRVRLLLMQQWLFNAAGFIAVTMILMFLIDQVDGFDGRRADVW